MDIRVASDFTNAPAGRYAADGPFSGERFRENLLAPAIRRGGPVTVHLDDVEGYGSSFLEEAFGGLVRVAGFSPDELRIKLRLNSDDAALVTEIWSYINEARAERVN